MTLNVHLIPQLKDNYCFAITSTTSQNCAVVDPAEADLVLDFLKKKNLTLKTIFNTHYHADHTFGNTKLNEATQCEIYGPEKEKDKIPDLNNTLSDLDIIKFENHKIKILETPGHTLGHISYWFYEDDLLFCGDTLFSCGCGFLFDGSFEQMWLSLCKLRALPKETLVYCGHEYTLNNIHFAKSLEKDNEDLNEYELEVKKKRSKNIPTIPFKLEHEILVNPFLRADLPKWKNIFQQEEDAPVDIFKMMREKKNDFKT